MKIKTSEILSMSPTERKQLAIRERMKGMTTVDVVRAWYTAEEPFNLTTEEDDIRRRWDFAKAQFLDRKPYAETLKAVMDEFSVSISCARNDVRNMRHTFGDLDEVPKQAHRLRAIEMSLAAFEVAREAKDGKAMAAATKVYADACGLGKDDAERIDIERMMKERTYVEALDPLARNFLLNFLKQGGSVDSSQLFDKMYEASQGAFIDYEETTDAEETETTEPDTDDDE